MQRVAIAGHTGRGNYEVNAHHRMAKAMIDRIEGRKPEYELLEGGTARRHVEWAMAARAAHMAGARVALALDTAHNPFDSWQS